jgi:hypothetical protein
MHSPFLIIVKITLYQFFKYKLQIVNTHLSWKSVLFGVHKIQSCFSQALTLVGPATDLQVQRRHQWQGPQTTHPGMSRRGSMHERGDVQEEDARGHGPRQQERWKNARSANLWGKASGFPKGTQPP